ncbi:MAG: C39 family peptidase [Chloroflexi bacterium]|nr:C39 family peptidase [Chloroflexota bacterium]MBI5715590.1 C39 family peptidase [Chloroflexota bacterium]
MVSKEFFSKITTLQWLVLGILIFANAALVILLAIIALSQFRFDSILLQRLPQAEKVIVQVITATPTRTPALAATRKQTLIPTSTRTPAPTLTVTPTLVFEPLNTPIPLTPSRTPTSAATPTLPPQARLWNVVGFPQALPLSCEAHIAVVLASHFGVTINEIEFFKRLPISDNPEAGFVGDVFGAWGQIPPDAYGVHAEPVAALMRQYNVPATAWKGLTLDDLRSEIAAGRPVGIWVTGHTAPGEPLEYITPAGDKVIVARYEHTVVVIGYTHDSFLILDGDDTYYRSIEQFTKSWNALGNMAILRGR